MKMLRSYSLDSVDGATVTVAESVDKLTVTFSIERVGERSSVVLTKEMFDAISNLRYELDLEVIDNG